MKGESHGDGSQLNTRKRFLTPTGGLTGSELLGLGCLLLGRPVGGSQMGLDFPVQLHILSYESMK